MTKLKMIKELEKYDMFFYNGFNKPKFINLNDLIIESNYQGDITELFKEELDYYLNNYTIEEIIEIQPFCIDFNIWIEPSFKDLSEYNLSVGLEATDYLEAFIE